MTRTRQSPFPSREPRRSVPEKSGLFRLHGAVQQTSPHADQFEQEARSRTRSGGPIRAIDAGHLARQGAEINPALETPMNSGRRLEPGVQAQMESHLGFDFSGVRIHDDTRAAATNARMGSNAVTTGSHIAFARGRYQPNDATGRELIAHELTHVVQQRNHRSVQMDKADKGDQVLTTNWDVQFQLNKPSAEEMSADPASVLTPAGLSSLKLVQAAIQSNPALEAELEGNASVEGPPAFNVQLSVNRARYLARIIGIGRVTNVPGRKHDCTQIEDGLFGCGTMHAHPTIDPSDRRVHFSMFAPPTPGLRPPGPIGGPTGSGEAKKPDDVKKPDETQKQGKPGGETGTGPATSTQWSGGLSTGFTAHSYLTKPGPGDPANEAVVQLIGAYTYQRHREGKRGLELGVPVQLQVSLQTGVVSLAGGGQLSYVIPFGNNKWQWGAFAQVLLGEAIDLRGGSASTQFQPSVGTQIMFQPKKWLQLGAQATAGVTAQTGGPASVDYGGSFVIQFVH